MSKPVIEIHYCRTCRFVLRATWMAQELLFTFSDDLGALSLIPDEGGTFRVQTPDGKVIFDRKTAGRFPESKELKQLIRDIIAPGKDLGHSDKQ
jgi:selenoprotein W-related protein